MNRSAGEVYREMAAVYARCVSYADEGEVRRTIVRGERGHERRTEVKPFRTWFVRPDRFRFECREQRVGPEEEWPRLVVWADRDVARVWWTVRQEVQEAASLAQALLGAAGVSAGASYFVPRLLMLQEAKPVTGAESGGFEIGGEERVAGRACVVLRRGEGGGAGARGRTLWIDAERHVLVQMHTSSPVDQSSRAEMIERIKRMAAEAEDGADEQGGVAERLDALRGAMDELQRSDYRLEATTVYRPRVDERIEGEVFAFSPER